MEHPVATDRPLSGVKVLDLSQVLAGPYCTRLLADAGAEVIKIEPPHGDSTRGYPTVLADGYSGYFLWLNCGKKSVVADLHTVEGRDLVKALATSADVVVENARPGSLDAKGLGYSEFRQLRPDIVMCSISAFGRTGVFADRPGHGIVAEGLAGVIDMTGYANESPMPLGVSLADVSAGIHAYAAILTALYARLRTGRGDFIDVSLFDAALPYHETALEEVEFGGASPVRSGTDHRSVVPYGVYSAPDDYVVIAAGTEGLWSRLSALLTAGLGPADVDLSTNARRIEHRAIVRARIERWLAAQKTAEAAIRALGEAGVPCGPIQRVKDVPNSELALSRDSFVLVPDHVLGEARVLNTPYRVTNSTVGPRSAAPLLGENTAQVMAGIRGGGEAGGWGTPDHEHGGVER